MDRVEIIRLYDIYSSLLTDKQKEYFEDYYYLDLSLSEIADNHNISRNGVYDQIKKVVDMLISYESKLKLNEKYNKLLSLDLKNEEIKKIEDIIWGDE